MAKDDGKRLKVGVLGCGQIAQAAHFESATKGRNTDLYVLCEKPLGLAIEEVEELKKAVAASGRKLQVGHMKRFDPGLQSAKAFIDDGIGQLLALKAWYCDSTHRYPMTDAV